VPRFYSAEWVAAFNAAVGDLDAGEVGAGGMPGASGGRFRVAQVVRGAPEGELVVVLVARDGHLSLELGEPASSPAGGASSTARPDVTVSLSYDDAVAMSRGQLDPAEAVGTGRIRVRGDLAVLVAGHALLAAAAPLLRALQAATTY
jgi:hypothetical protein